MLCRARTIDIHDAIVEMSPVMTLCHYNLAAGGPHQDIIDIVRDAEDGFQS